MAIVGGLDIHRRQITYDWIDTDSGETCRGQLSPATRLELRAWLARFTGQQADFALEATTGWRFVAEELQRAGAVAHLAEPADTRALRGPSGGPRLTAPTCLAGGGSWRISLARQPRYWRALVLLAPPSQRARWRPATWLTPWPGCSRCRAGPRPRHSRTPPSAPWPPSQGPRPGRHTPAGRTRRSAPWSRQMAHRSRSPGRRPPGSWSPWRRPAAAPRPGRLPCPRSPVEGEERLEEAAFLRAARRRRLGRVGGQDQGVLHGRLLYF
jgi:hypothetical protein